MAALDAPELQARLLEAVGRCGNVKAAAQQIGLTRRTVSTFAKKHPAFGASIKDECMRWKQLAHNGPRVAAMSAPSGAVAQRGPTPAPASGGDPEGGSLTRAEYLAKLEEVYGNTEHPSWHHAARLLGAWHLEPAMVRRRKAAELEAEPTNAVSTRPVFVTLPSNGTEATPRAPFRGGVIDAEVID